jgi:hypothetical protein
MLDGFSSKHPRTGEIRENLEVKNAFRAFENSFEHAESEKGRKSGTKAPPATPTPRQSADVNTASGTADAVALPATSIGPCFRVRRAARATRFATKAGAKRMTSGSAQITYNRATDREIRGNESQGCSHEKAEGAALESGSELHTTRSLCIPRFDPDFPRFALSRTDRT